MNDEFNNPFLDDGEDEVLLRDVLPRLTSTKGKQVSLEEHSDEPLPSLDLLEHAAVQAHEGALPELPPIPTAKPNLHEMSSGEEDEDDWGFEENKTIESINSTSTTAVEDEDWSFDDILGESEASWEATPPTTTSGFDDWQFDEGSTFATEDEIALEEALSFEATTGSQQANEPSDEEHWEPEDDFIPPANPFAMLADEPPQPSAAEATAAEEEPGLSEFLGALDETEEVAASPEENTPWRSRMGAKLRELKHQIKAELRGEDAEGESENTPAKDSPEEASQPRGMPAPLRLIATPYMWMTKKLTSLIMLVFGILSKLPLIGGFLRPLSQPSRLLTILGSLLPLLLIVGFLYWQGAKPLPATTTMSFPDEGSVSVTAFGYNDSRHEAFATITNTGEVIANVTPILKVESRQMSLNPLSFFFAKSNPSCKGSPVSVPIDGKIVVNVNCPIEGKARKITGVAQW